MAAGTTEELNPFPSFRLEVRIVHEGSVGVLGRILLLERDEITGDVLSVRNGKAKARHHRPVLDLELMAVVRALAVVEVENDRQSLLLVILVSTILLLVVAIGARPLPRLVD